MIVTGGGAGIGRAAALAMARAGATVAVWDLDGVSARATVSAVNALGGAADFEQVDVTSATQVERAVARLLKMHGRLDAAFNNAGILGAVGTALVDLEEQDWDRVLAVNLKSVWLCMKYQIPPMLAAGRGAIVNMSSLMGLQAAPFNIAYGAAKHGVLGATRSAAAFYGSRGIRINAVCPGTVDTDLAATIAARLGSDAPARAALNPMHRSALPEEIANTVVWLCADAASFINGAAIAIDGGQSIV